jgi:tetratricopeptide (TPR) repeat protein
LYKVIYISLIGFLIWNSSCTIKKNSSVLDNPIVTNDTKLKEQIIKATTEKALGNYDEALELYKVILKTHPKTAVAHFEVSEVYEIKRNAGNAIIHGEKAVALAPDNQWYAAHLGKVYKQTSQFDKSEIIFKTLSEKHPQSTNYLFQYAEALLYQNKIAETIPVYDKIEETTGPYEELTMYKNKLYLELGQPQMAITEMEKLIAEFPAESRYYGILAEMYENAGEDEKALELYNKILKMDPSNGYVHLSLASYYKYHNQKDKSREEMKIGFANPTVDVKDKATILNEYFINSKTNEDTKKDAYDLLEIALNAHPEEADIYTMYSEFLFRDKKTEEAIANLKKALEIDNSDLNLWYKYVTSLNLNSKYSELETACNEAKELFPNQPTFYYFSGIAKIQTKNYSAAIIDLDYGKDLVLNNPSLKGEFYQFLGDAYHSEMDHTNSDYSFSKALDLYPENLYVLNNYSYYLSVRKEKLDLAETMAQKANLLSPNNATYQDTYGWVLFQAGKYNLACEWLKKSIENGGSSSGVVLEHYGDALYKSGKVVEAKSHWIKAKEKGGSSDEIDQKINTGTL